MKAQNKQGSGIKARKTRKNWGRTIGEGIVMIAVVVLIELVAQAGHLIR